MLQFIFLGSIVWIELESVCNSALWQGESQLFVLFESGTQELMGYF